MLIQVGHVGPDAPAVLARMASEFGAEVELLEGSPFVLVGSVEQIVEKLSSLRERLGVSHVVLRDAEAFAPVVSALRGH